MLGNIKFKRFTVLVFFSQNLTIKSTGASSALSARNISPALLLNVLLLVLYTAIMCITHVPLAAQPPKYPTKDEHDGVLSGRCSV